MKFLALVPNSLLFGFLLSCEKSETAALREARSRLDSTVQRVEDFRLKNGRLPNDKEFSGIFVHVPPQNFMTIVPVNKMPKPYFIRFLDGGSYWYVYDPNTGEVVE